MVELNEVHVQKVKFRKLKKTIDINEVDIDCIFYSNIQSISTSFMSIVI